MDERLGKKQDDEFVWGIWHQPNSILGSQYTWTLSKINHYASTGGVANSIEEAEARIEDAKLWLGIPGA